MARSGICGLLVAATLALAAPPALAADWTPKVAVTHHQGVFNGQALNYTATVSEALVADAAGKGVGTTTTIAYVRDGVADPAQRPVIFAFNGGPGASSSPLHMS